MATSGSNNWALTRDNIITLALRRINAIGQGETPTTSAITEGATALNAIVKAVQADGMPLWKVTVDSFTPTANTTAYTWYVGGTINKRPPLRIHQAWYQHNTTNVRTPLQLATRNEYYLLSNPTTAGVPSILNYQPPGNQGETSQEMKGTVNLYVAPSTSFVADNKIYVIGQFPFEDFDASGDYPDFPSSWNNALAWMLAFDLSHEYGCTPVKISQIEKAADKARALALSGGAEEGSLFIQPNYNG
jgi:hypothetical protein